jgi:osmoprotectant transport system ATP-binding protein
VIELQNVSKRFTDANVLENVSIRVERGELVILIGPSGCGKSTLLRMVNRMIEPSAGTILIDGRDSSTLDPVELRRGIGYVIQSIGLFPHMSVRQNVEVVPSILGTPRPERRARAEALLETVGLDPVQYGGRYPRELSGGQQQRVGIARALAADPPILLMDEPFGALDPLARDRLQDEFLRIKTEIQKTIVFVTHDLDEAIKLGDRICLLNAGSVQQFDTPERMLRHPANAFVESFLGPDRELKRLARLPITALMRPAGRGPRPNDEISVGSSAKDALSKLLAGVAQLAVIDGETFLGVVALSDFADRDPSPQDIDTLVLGTPRPPRQP